MQYNSIQMESKQEKKILIIKKKCNIICGGDYLAMPNLFFLLLLSKITIKNNY